MCLYNHNFLLKTIHYSNKFIIFDLSDYRIVRIFFSESVNTVVNISHDFLSY